MILAFTCLSCFMHCFGGDLMGYKCTDHSIKIMVKTSSKDSSIGSDIDADSLCQTMSSNT